MNTITMNSEKGKISDPPRILPNLSKENRLNENW